jgi:antitoxin component YwqK of YwqJK toxin-antitoxin module
MYKLLPALLLCVLSSLTLLAQPTGTQLPGSYIDLNGKMIYGNLDQDFAPSEPFAIFLPTEPDGTELNYNSYYTTTSGEVVKGSISLSPGSGWFSFKKDFNSKSKRITPEVGWSLKIGSSSFIVANNLPLYSNIGEMITDAAAPRFLEFLRNTDRFTFFETSLPNGKKNYVVKQKESGKLTVLPIVHKAFMGVVSPLFSQYPHLLDLLQKKELATTNIEAIIKFIQYSDALEAGKPLYYTAHWKMTTIPSEATYLATVSRTEDQWKLEYTDKEDQKIATEHYRYHQPQTKHGEFIWYYPSTGHMRRKITFHMGKQENHYYFYHSNGTLHYETMLTSEGKTKYFQVLTPEGVAVLDAKGQQGNEEYYDEARKRTFFREFRNGQLLSSYYLNDQQQKIYQLASNNVSIKAYKATQKAITSYIKYPNIAIKDEVEGLVMVQAIVDGDGLILEKKVLKGLSASIDQTALNLLSDRSVNLRFSAGKHEKENVHQEVIIPVYFSLSRKPVADNYYYNPFIMNPVFMPAIPAGVPRF